MTDAEILTAMRAMKYTADRLQQKKDALYAEADGVHEQLRDMWQQIHRLHNALLHPDPAL